MSRADTLSPVQVKERHDAALAALGPMPVVKRRLSHVLEPGMLVRPRNPDGTQMDAHRWVVDRVSTDGAFAYAHSGNGKQNYSAQWFAADTLIPCKRKGSGKIMRITDVKVFRRKKTDPSINPPLMVKKQVDPAAVIATAAAKAPKVKPPKAAPSEAVASMQQLLLGRDTLEGWLEVAAGYGVSWVDEARHGYCTLGPGLQRMNIGNRLRSFINKNPGAVYVPPTPVKKKRN